ncbi:MAG: photosystem II cytochrome c-550 [Cyanobacteria bacterium P01_E01_bin.34]
MFRLLSSFKKFTTWMLAGLLVLTAGFSLSSAQAATFSAEDRTVLLDGNSTITFSEAEMDRGRRLFGPTCGHCHIAGSTYTNPDIELSLDDLSNANPRRDTVDGIVDYVKNPTTYDGMESLADFHPNLDMDDIYIEMRGLSENDVKLIAGYILQQAKVNPGWGQSKNIAHDPTFERLQRK